MPGQTLPKKAGRPCPAGQSVHYDSDRPKVENCLRALSRWLISTDGIASVVDAMAGVGDSARLWQEEIQPKRLILNDRDKDLANSLRRNFAKAEVLSEDLRAFSWPSVDLAYLAFNNFSLGRFADWFEVFSRAANRARWVLIADSCCYGFFFGDKSSYRRYADTPEGYWILWAKMFHASFGLTVQVGSQMRHCAFLLCRRGASLRTRWDWLEPVTKQPRFPI